MTPSDISKRIATPSLGVLAPPTTTLTTLGRVLAACAALAVLAGGTALAQPGETTPREPTPELAPAAPAAVEAVDLAGAPEPADKSAAVSLGLAIGGTLASIGVLVAAEAMDSDPMTTIGAMGLLISPSLGHMYTGAPWRSAAGIALRGAGAGAAYYGITLMMQKRRDCPGCKVPSDLFFFGGGALMIGSALYGYIDAPFSAWRHNRRERAMTVTPAPIVGPGGSTGMGLQLGVSFR